MIDPNWLKPGGVVPVNAQTTKALVDEVIRLREFQGEIEEAEARVCPEDVGFEEYIRHLLSKLALAAEDAAGLRDDLAARCLPAIYEHHTKLTDAAADLAYEQAEEMLRARAK